MRTFIFLSILTLFLSFSNNVKANYSLTVSSEQNNNIIPPKNSKSNFIKQANKNKQLTKHKVSKKDKQISKQKRKEFRRAIWKNLKESRKNGIKDANPKIHWAAYLSFFGALVAITTIVAGLILKYAIFNVLFPVAIVLLIVSLIASIIGISVVASKEMTLYHKSKTITLSLIGGILALLSLLFIGFIIVALSNMVI